MLVVDLGTRLLLEAINNVIKKYKESIYRCGSLTNVPPWCLHGSDLTPSVCLNLILLCCPKDRLATVPPNGIDGVEGDPCHCVPHVLYGAHPKVHAWGDHMGNWCPSEEREREREERESEWRGK